MPQFHAVAVGDPEDMTENPFMDGLTRMGILEGRKLFRRATPEFPTEMTTEPEEFHEGMRIGWSFIRRDVFGWTQLYVIDGPAEKVT